MSEAAGVAVDFGTPGNPVVDSKGKKLEPRIEIVFEVDKQAARNVALAMSKMGQQRISDEITSQSGLAKVEANVIQRRPFLSGVVSGVLLSAAGYGIFRGMRALRAGRALKQGMAQGKVAQLMPPPRPMTAPRS